MINIKNKYKAAIAVKFNICQNWQMYWDRKLWMFTYLKDGNGRHELMPGISTSYYQGPKAARYKEISTKLKTRLTIKYLILLLLSFSSCSKPIIYRTITIVAIGNTYAIQQPNTNYIKIIDSGGKFTQHISLSEHGIYQVNSISSVCGITPPTLQVFAIINNIDTIYKSENKCEFLIRY